VFSPLEISNQQARPVALYEFRYGNTYWRYCTDDEDRTVNGHVWTAQVISDEGVTQGGSDQNDLQITVQADNPVAAIFRNGQLSGKVWLSVRRWHIGDPDEETPLLWSGTVVNAAVADNQAAAQMTCRSLGGSYDRQGLRLAWGRMCPHVLYSEFGCRVNKSLHAYPHTIETLSGTNFTVTTYLPPAEGSFTGGFAEFIREDGSFQRYGIEFQNGNDFRVFGSTSGLSLGSEVTLYPGCSRDTASCKRFDNLANFGGFPHLPGKSPFDGSPVF
jgi:uncharacterized phage protein (TIGR02218 family)